MRLDQSEVSQHYGLLKRHMDRYEFHGRGGVTARARPLGTFFKLSRSMTGNFTPIKPCTPLAKSL